MSPSVTLLTPGDCSHCEHVNAVVHRIADEFSLSVRMVDLRSADGGEMASSLELTEQPAVLINGVLFSQGRISERRLRKALRLAVAAAASKVASPVITAGADPELPEPPLSGAERGAERLRLRAVRRERRRQSMARKKDRKNNKKDQKKEMNGKRR